jgi:1-deoxy-D-xylulose-5-phosphate reductoisomerase
MKRITILGSTGSIGWSTLDVIGRHPESYRIHALTAHRNVKTLVEQCLAYRPDVAVMVDPEAARQAREHLRAAGCETEVRSGAEALVTVAQAPDTDQVMAAIVGAAGLLPTLAAAQAGKRVLLANKEALVVSGALLLDAVRQSGAVLLPIDSEHNAIFQCLPDGRTAPGVERILLTASGGPFRTRDPATLDTVTPDEACAHPKWSMGRKISVDSATMMNKGLEVIEAHWLFGLAPERIQVVIHPQSIVHSMVAYADGSVLAQLGNPDMRTPIAHALAWPERMEAGVAPLDLMTAGALGFEPPDGARFPCLGLAYQALESGGTASILLNAANEVAVDAFLRDALRYSDIPHVIGATLETLPVEAVTDLASVLEADRRARASATRVVTRLSERRTA